MSLQIEQLELGLFVECIEAQALVVSDLLVLLTHNVTNFFFWRLKKFVTLGN